MWKEYVSLIQELYKNNGSVLNVAIHAIWLLYTLIPICMGSCHGQILIEMETYSLPWTSSFTAIISPQKHPLIFQKSIEFFKLSMNRFALDDPPISLQSWKTPCLKTIIIDSIWRISSQWQSGRQCDKNSHWNSETGKLPGNAQLPRTTYTWLKLLGSLCKCKLSWRTTGWRFVGPRCYSDMSAGSVYQYLSIKPIYAKLV